MSWEFFQTKCMKISWGQWVHVRLHSEITSRWGSGHQIRLRPPSWDTHYIKIQTHEEKSSLLSPNFFQGTKLALSVASCQCCWEPLGTVDSLWAAQGGRWPSILLHSSLHNLSITHSVLAHAHTLNVAIPLSSHSQNWGCPRLNNTTVFEHWKVLYFVLVYRNTALQFPPCALLTLFFFSF